MEAESDHDHEAYQKASPKASPVPDAAIIQSSNEPASPSKSNVVRMEEESEEKDHKANFELKKHCQVCFSDISGPFQDEYLERLFKLVYCSCCGASSHLICHGLSTPLEEGTQEFEGFKCFVCDRCREGSQKTELICYICGTNDGFFRMTKDKRWIHTLCAVSSPGVHFEDVNTMIADLSFFRKDTQKISLKKRCEVCTAKVETVPCTGSDKGKYCHLHCVLNKSMKSPENKPWKVAFGLVENKKAKVGQHVDEKKIAEDAEDMALSLKALIEKVGMRGELGIIMELKQKKNAKTTRDRKRIAKDDPRVNKFVEGIVEQAHVLNNAVLDEESLKQEDAKDVGGKFIVSCGGTNLDVNFRGTLSKQEFVDLLQSLYWEFIDEKGLLEAYSEEKIPKLRGNLPDFPVLGSLSFPELLFFVCVFQKRAEAACNNLCTGQSLEALIRAAKMIPFALTAQLKNLNQKHFSALVTDILLEPYIARCKPESAYDPISSTFSGDKIRMNKGAIKQVHGLQMLYLKESCGVITQNFNLTLKYAKQLLYLKELYEGLAKHFNSDDTSKKDPFANLLKGFDFRKQMLPKVALTNLMLYYSKGKAVGLEPDFEELLLLEKLTNQNKKLTKPAKKRDFSEESQKSVGSNRSNSVGFGERAGKKSTTTKGKRTERKGRPRRAETLSGEIQNVYRLKMRRLNDKPTVEEAQKLLSRDDEGKYKDLEQGIDKALEWKEQFEDALESNNGRLGKLIDKVEGIPVRVPEMLKALEIKRDWELWRNNVEDLYKRIKKKTDDIFTEKDKMVTLDELMDVIDAKKKIIQLEQDDGKVRELERKVQVAFKLQDRIDNRENLKDFTQLKEIEHQVKGVNVYISEIELLKEKLNVNQQINKMIERPCTIGELEKVSQKLKESLDTANPDLIAHLTSKLIKGKKLYAEASNFLSIRRPYRLDELGLMAFLIKEADTNKLEGREIQAIQKVVQDFLLFGRVYATLFSVECIDLDKLENGQYTYFEGKSLSDLTKKCTETCERALPTLSEKKLKDLRDACNEFRNAHKDTSSYMYSFFEGLSSLLWNRNDREMPVFERKVESLNRSYNTTPRKFEPVPERMEIIEKYSRSPIQSVDKHRYTDSGISPAKSIRKEDEGQRIAEILEIAERSGDYEGLLDELEIIKERCRREDKGKSQTSDQVRWAIEAVRIKKEAEEEKKGVTFEHLERVVQKLELSGLSLKSGLGRILSAWHKKAGNARREYYREYEEKKIKLNLKDLEGMHIEELAERNRRKPGYDDALNILQTLKSVKQFVALDDEIDMVQKDMESFEEWAFMLKEIMRKYSPLLENYIEVDGRYAEYVDTVVKGSKEEEAREALRMKTEFIRKDINGLKQEMVNMPLRRRIEEANFRAFGWLFDSVLLISGLDSKKDMETIDATIKVGKRFEAEKDDRVEKMIRIFRKELYRANEIKKFVEKLKRGDSRVPVSEVQRTVEDLEQCQVLLTNEEDMLEEYCKRHGITVDGKHSQSKSHRHTNTGSHDYEIAGLHEESDVDTLDEGSRRESIRQTVNNKTSASKASLGKMLLPADRSNNSSVTKDKLPIQHGPPQGSVLRVYEGSLEDMDDKEYQKINLYTCDPMDTVTIIPQIGDKNTRTNLRIEKKVPLNRFEAYLTFTFDHRQKRSEKVISGWIESSISIYQSRCDQIAKELLTGDLVAVCGYNESTRIFLIHMDQMREDWKTKLDFKKRKTHMSSNPTLLFILVHKPYKLQLPASYIVPEQVASVDDKDTATKGAPTKQKSESQLFETEDAQSYNDDNDSLNSSIEISPIRDDAESQQGDDEQEGEFNEEQDNEIEPYEGDENVAEMDREQRLMLGETEWTLNGKRPFEAIEHVGYVQEGEEGMNEEEEGEEFAMDGAIPVKKVKLEESKYKDLLERLQGLDQEQIIEVAQGLDYKEREVVIQLLKDIHMMQQDAQEDEQEPAQVGYKKSNKVTPHKGILTSQPQNHPETSFGFHEVGVIMPWREINAENPSFGGLKTSPIGRDAQSNVEKISPISHNIGQLSTNMYYTPDKKAPSASKSDSVIRDMRSTASKDEGSRSAEGKIFGRTLEYSPVNLTDKFNNVNVWQSSVGKMQNNLLSQNNYSITNSLNERTFGFVQENQDQEEYAEEDENDDVIVEVGDNISAQHWQSMINNLIMQAKTQEAVAQQGNHWVQNQYIGDY